jgi:predicted subunit of tRNA(5-methylaminomethyl-2-thiouridylate) methyltransferase
MDSEALAAASAAFMEAANKMGLNANQTAAGLAGIAQKMNATSSQLGKLAANLESAAVGSRAQGTAARNAGLELGKVISSARASARSQDEFREAANRAANSMIDSVSDPRMKASIRRYADAQMDAADRAETFRNVISLASKPVGALGNVVSSTFNAYQAGGTGIGTSAALLQAEFKATGGMISFLGGIVTQFGGAVTLSSIAFTKMPNLVTLIGGGVTILGSLMQAAGKGIQEIADKVLPKLQQEVEKNIAAFMTMSNSGALFAGGLQKMVFVAATAELTLDQLSKVVAANKDSFAALGEGVSGGLQRVVNVMDAGKDNLRKRLLNLGFSVEEQAGLIADVTKDMQGAGKPLPQNKETSEMIAQETAKYAENLRVIANFTGEDAKAKMAQARDAATNLAFQQKLMDLDPKMRAAAQESMVDMTEAEKKLFMEKFVNNGQAMTTASAMLEQQNSGIRKSMDDIIQSLNDGSGSLEKTLQIQAQHQRETEQQWQEGNRNIGRAALIGVGGPIQEFANAMGGARGIIQTNRRRSGIGRAVDDVAGQARPGKNDLQTEMVNSIVANQKLNVEINQTTFKFGVMSTYMEMAAAAAESFTNGLNWLVEKIEGLRSTAGIRAVPQALPEFQRRGTLGLPGETEEQYALRRQKRDQEIARITAENARLAADNQAHAAEMKAGRALQEQLKEQLKERQRIAPGAPTAADQNVPLDANRPRGQNSNTNPAGTTVTPPVQATPNARGASANMPVPPAGSAEWYRQNAAAYHTSGLVVQPNNPNATTLPNGPNANETEQQRQARVAAEAQARQAIDEQDEREARTPNRQSETMQQQRASVPSLLESLGTTMVEVKIALASSLEHLAKIETNTNKTALNTI